MLIFNLPLKKRTVSTIARYVLLLCITSILLTTCASNKALSTADQLESGTLFLWTVSNEDTQLHILGSIHIAPSSIYPLPDTIYSLFDQSPRLLLEINPLERDPMDLFDSRRFMEYPVGKRIQDDLNPDELTRLQTALSEIAIPLGMVENWQPWVLEAAVITSAAQEAGINIEHGIDIHFALRARQKNLPIDTLETVRQQLELFNRIPTRTQAAQLMTSIDDYQNINDYLIHLVEMWQSGDITGLEKTILPAFGENPELQIYYDQFFLQRNITWTEILSEYLENGQDAFVVVGAGHLIGPDSLITMLERRGYQITRY